MDLYGIGTAINGALRIYFHTARHTGRTRAMLNSVKDGDRIIFSNSIEAKRVQRMLKERGLEVTCMTLSPFDLQSVYAHKPQGRTIFDHTWVELFYEHAISNAQKLLDQMETQLSTVPEPRPMTKYREWVEDVWGQI